MLHPLLNPNSSRTDPQPAVTAVCCCCLLQGNNVEAVANMVPVTSAAPSPTAKQQRNSQLIPNLDLFGASAQNRSSSQGRSQGSVGVGPGQDVQSVAQDITEGRWTASDLDK